MPFFTLSKLEHFRKEGKFYPFSKCTSLLNVARHFERTLKKRVLIELNCGKAKKAKKAKFGWYSQNFARTSFNNYFGLGALSQKLCSILSKR